MIQSLVKTKVLGVDIGLEKTTYAIVDVRGNILAKDSFLTQDYPNFNTFLSVFCERAINMIMSNGEYEEIRSMGVSAPSANLLTGNIEYSGNLPWQGEIPLSAVLRDRLGLAAAVANDAHVRALGESTYGCAHGMKDFIYLTLGHGIGSCIFSNGHAHLGSNGFGGEIGHCCIYPGGRQCTCGSRGCLEAYCGANGIVQTAKEMMAESDQPSLMREQAELTPKLIAELCDQGDEMAIEVFRRTGFILGIALANYASVINPEAIILTGDMMVAGKWLLKPMRAAFDQHVFHNIRGDVRILVSILKEGERDVLGASALAWDVKEYSLFK
jgi:glucokinase